MKRKLNVTAYPGSDRLGQGEWILGKGLTVKRSGGHYSIVTPEGQITLDEVQFRKLISSFIREVFPRD